MVTCPFAGCGVQLRRMDRAGRNYTAAVQHSFGEHKARLELHAKMVEAIDQCHTYEEGLCRGRDAAVSKLEALQEKLILEGKSRAALESKTSSELFLHNLTVGRLRTERDAARLEAAKLRQERDKLVALGAKRPGKGNAQPAASKKRRMAATGASAEAEASRLRPSTRGAACTTHSGRKLGPA